jgi:endo-1,4-beta-xylanase
LRFLQNQSLKDVFSSKFKIGTSVSPNELNYGQDFIKKHFNSITPENELKPDAILDQNASKQSGNNVNAKVSFRSGTQATLRFCEQNGIPLRGHTFVWHAQTPEWFFRENFEQYTNFVSRDIMNQRLENFIKNTFELLARDYPRLQVYAYDVCNEVFQGAGGGIRPAGESKWMQIYGDDSYIVNAFTYARKYAPRGCKLYINDFNEYMNPKTQNIYDMAMKLKQLGVIDGIGMQSHLGVSFPSAQMYAAALDKFCSTGLEVQITELDINMEGNEDAQANLYREVFNSAVRHANQIPAVTFWGTHDSVSWIKDKNPLPFGNNYELKKAFYAIMQVAGA